MVGVLLDGCLVVVERPGLCVGVGSSNSFGFDGSFDFDLVNEPGGSFFAALTTEAAGGRRKDLHSIRRKQGLKDFAFPLPESFAGAEEISLSQALVRTT